jgi:polar amino acid transport system substrate-binding protein
MTRNPDRTAEAALTPIRGTASTKETFMKIHNILAALACAVVLAALPARAQTAPQSTIDIMEQRGTMMVGMTTFVPWAMRDAQGKLVGFEVDVATKLAQDLGLKLDLVPTAWDGIIPALIAGKFDVIIGGMTITTKRNLTVNFSAPYDYAGTGLAVAVAMQKDFKVDMLNSPSVTIACRRGSTACMNAAEYFPKATLRQFDDDAAMTQEVLNGNANAFAASEPLPSRTTIENPGKLFTPLSQQEQLNRLPSGMAIRKGDVDTLNVLNNWIAANTKFLQTRRHYWFETQDWRAAVGKGN